MNGTCDLSSGSKWPATNFPLDFSIHKIIAESFENIESRMNSPKSFEASQLPSAIFLHSSLMVSDNIEGMGKKTDPNDFSTIAENIASNFTKSVNNIFEEVFGDQEERKKAPKSPPSKLSSVFSKTFKGKNPEIIEEIPEDESMAASSFEGQIKPESADFIPLNRKKSWMSENTERREKGKDPLEIFLSEGAKMSLKVLFKPKT
jgi:hypothetical protein